MSTLHLVEETFPLCMVIAMVNSDDKNVLEFKLVIIILHRLENLLRGINDLIALIKKLQQDIANQHDDIRRLHTLIENCAGCQEPQNLRVTCQYANPCFPGKCETVFNLHLIGHISHPRHRHYHPFSVNLVIYCSFFLLSTTTTTTSKNK